MQLVEFPVALRPLWHKVGIVEAFVEDEVVVRFGEVCIQVPAEWVAPVAEG